MVKMPKFKVGKKSQIGEKIPKWKNCQIRKTITKLEKKSKIRNLGGPNNLKSC